MTKIKLVDGTIIDAVDVELVNGVLKITVKKNRIEELIELFEDKSNTSYIVLMTESGVECGYKTGFTSFAGIMYHADGTKVIELFQPVDATEARISNAEGAANSAVNTANQTSEDAKNMASEMSAAITDVELAITELYEMALLGGE